MKLGLTAMIGGKAVMAVVELPPVVWIPRDKEREPTPEPDTFPQALLRIDLADDDHQVTFI
jgi:hypothetical protein